MTTPLATQTQKLAIAVDDSKTVLVMVRKALEGAGYRVRTALDPGELSEAEVKQASVVVVDVQMEQVFGDDAVSFFRQQWGINLPIFLFSNLSQDELDERAAAAGATGAVSKQAGIEALVSKIKRELGDA